MNLGHYNEDKLNICMVVFLLLATLCLLLSFLVGFFFLLVQWIFCIISLWQSLKLLLTDWQPHFVSLLKYGVKQKSATTPSFDGKL